MDFDPHEYISLKSIIKYYIRNMSEFYSQKDGTKHGYFTVDKLSLHKAY